MLKLLGFVLPLGRDPFAAATAIGAARPAGASQWMRISLILVVFEGGCC